MLKPISIGSLKLDSNLFIAPLAGYTNLPTRQIYRRMGASMAYAEMVSAEGLHYNYDKSVKLIDSGDNDTPLGVQLFGSNREKILRAFEKIKHEKFDLVDINCGCSVRKIINSGAGASLLQNPEEIYQIISGLKTLTDKPVTLKIRSGWDHAHINFPDVYDAGYKAGADLITLHPRTKSMLFDGKADWSHIAELKRLSKIPVIGNGDIFRLRDAIKMFEETGCDGIMLARGVLENPYLIEEISAYFKGFTWKEPDIHERLELAKEHCASLVAYTGNEEKALIEFRKFFKGYARDYPGITHLRQAVNQAVSYKEFSTLINEFFIHSKKYTDSNS